LQTHEIEETGLPEAPKASEPPIAPVWHTVVLLLGILSISIAGKLQLVGVQHRPNRLLTYATTAGMELLMLGWVALGLRLRRVPFRSLLGKTARGLRGWAIDFGIAAAFWIGALMILGTAGILWTSVETAISLEHNRGGGHAEGPSQKNAETLRTLEELAPENGTEIAGWVLLCCFAGTIEELVFRGYLQRQFTAWARGGAAWGVAFSAVMFGAAHGYQGARNMVLLAVFGALFSALAIMRRSLRAGIIAHSWHDLIAGLTLALLRSHRLL
jgi:membrane protease YdiL (CAAX protease family)